MNAVAEQCLRDTILPELDNGRQGWDRPHTELVVMYAKEIIAATPTERFGELDEEVIVPAAYGHDWGYAGLVSGSEDAMDFWVKIEHMQRGARLMEALLQRSEFDYLSDPRKNRICHLIGIHDEVEDLRQPDELVLMEADTLAGFDDRVVSTLSPRVKIAWRKRAMSRRVGRFITDYSREKIALLTGVQ